MLYREQYGPFNAALRIESQLAKLGSYFISGKSQRDLCTWPKEPEEEATLEGVFGMLKVAASKGMESK